MMRVVGGTWRGRALVAPSGQSTRPTSDKAREAVFDVLAALPEARRPLPDGAADPAGVLAGHRCLDLFAGSGALGIEALSRGAAHCTFVERDRQALRALTDNLGRIGVDRRTTHDEGPEPASSTPRTRVLSIDYRQALQADARRGALYTLLFVDPPYTMYAEVEPVLDALARPVLAPGAILVVETASRARVGLPWRIAREKRYGDTRVTFLVADDESDPGGAHGNDATAT